MNGVQCSRRCIRPVARRSRGEATGTGESRGRCRREAVMGETGSRPTGSLLFVTNLLVSLVAVPPIFSSLQCRLCPLLPPCYLLAVPRSGRSPSGSSSPPLAFCVSLFSFSIARARFLGRSLPAGRRLAVSAPVSLFLSFLPLSSFLSG